MNSFKNLNEATSYVEDQESTDISYTKIGEGSKSLIISFASNQHSGFERKTTLLEQKYNQNAEFDILYMRSPETWYLNGLSGIGTCIDHTIEFLKEQFCMYDDVITVGGSMGGYASILFGSICGANTVLAKYPQTDLEYSVMNCLPEKTEFEKGMKCYAFELALARQGKSKVILRNVYHKYKNLRDVINETVDYNIFCFPGKHGNHGEHHCKNISNFKCVNIHPDPRPLNDPFNFKHNQI